ncbi:YceI family protein [Aureitalea marina]|uniref:Lipid/polyisoprenoid-binding YceI-like domain-containing protein n=1 Tax=Aureitalea marina TaxID=930804 RepID=A0A2S7KLL0_9FLAO|nr:YceI family protein [Aureitalea marina]PQB03519.1 hypothetical protein BST85_00360 [Aureitalea marina]
MKKSILFILIVPFSLLAQHLEVATPTQISWQGKAAYSSYSPEGSLQLLSGRLSLKDGVIDTLNIVIDMRSLQQENQQLRDHLRDADFFDVERFPVATFILTEPLKQATGEVELVGNLTIKGNTKEERIKANISESSQGLSLQFEHQMDRTEYGVTFNSPSFFENLKDQAIDDHFSLKGTIQFTSR